MTGVVRITHPDVVHDVGDVVDLDDAKAERLVNIGYAEYVNDQTDDAEAPTKSALKSDWIEHAVASGADRAEAEAMTKDELVDRFG